MITFLFLSISTFCFSQVESQNLIGKWQYLNTTNLQDSVIESSVEKFELEIFTDGTFKMRGGKKQISGNWKLEGTLLELDRTGKNEVESKIQKLHIHKLSKSNLSIRFSTEYEMKALLNLTKIE